MEVKIRLKNWKSKLDYKIVSQNLAIKLEAKIGLYGYKVGSQNWTIELEVKIGLYVQLKVKIEL